MLNSYVKLVKSFFELSNFVNSTVSIARYIYNFNYKSQYFIHN